MDKRIEFIYRIAWSSKAKKNACYIFYFAHNFQGNTEENFILLLRSIIKNLPKPKSKKADKGLIALYIDKRDDIKEDKLFMEIDTDSGKRGYVLFEKPFLVKSTNLTPGIITVDILSYLMSWQVLNPDEYSNYLKKKGILHSAGRGWYSLLGDKLYLDREPVREVVSIIRDNFPGLKFSCWSTEQLKDFFLHIPFDFLTFVYVEREFMEYVRELLEERKYTVYKNPSQKEAGKFISVKERTIILRPFARIRNEMTEFASIEKILVDLYREIYRLNLMDMEEYKNILQSVARNYVINMSKFLDYAYERKMKKT